MIKNLLIRLGLVVLFCALILSLPRLGALLTKRTSGQAEDRTPARLTSKAVYDQLKTVKDLELGVNLVDLGLIKEVRIEGDKVAITMLLTSPLCPYADILIYQIKQQVKKIGAVADVDVTIDLDTVWHPEMISKEGNERLKELYAD